MANLEATTKYVEFYLEKLRCGESEAAFHGLVEASPSVVPLLINAFRRERSPAVRAELIKIIWNHRRPETAGFLAEALEDLDQRVWKNALDGLVTLASPSVLQILQTASTRELPSKKQQDEFRRWVNEAIIQVQTAIKSLGV